MEEVDLRRLKASPRHRILKTSDNYLELVKEQEEFQSQFPNENVEIGHDSRLGVLVLFTSTKRVRY